MAKSDLKINNRKEDYEGLVYVFPKTEEIRIGRSELHILLGKFKERIQKSFSIFDLLAIISLWSPTVSADFKPFFIFDQAEVRGGYITFAFMITMFIMVGKISIIWQKNNMIDSDPEKMAQKILEQCQKKK
ncbi:MAG: hypothetical protein YFSK_2370 [Candidatus Yanofskyibacterium parasiticum]|nr:MAG: hypothetical protein YFSK_2370 [Candidatus Yanofskybacteria bacterium]